ncbi:N-methyl-D-aspartate receptor NMDAR2C subunit [Dyella sp.]|uniref:HD domain-containing protein n=1 Tax=Dyella sp. TaxID=1869338 RepID=UPI002ED630A4
MSGAAQAVPVEAVLGEIPWIALWQAWSLAAPVGLHRRLLDAYGEHHRAYHTGQHLEECLGLLDELWHDADRPHELALALWFHDAVYRPRRQDNEHVSAQWLVAEASQANVPDDAVDRMRRLVMATCHHAQPEPGDASLLVDIDLAILGANPERFAQYERQVRREFRWAPAPLYRAGRARVLRSFLDRPSIYVTVAMRDRFEAAARRNLQASLRQLCG